MISQTLRRISELLQTGQYSVAHAQLESLIAANPQNVEALRLLAGTKQLLGDPVQAEALLRRALQLDAAWPPTLTTLAELLLATGRTTEAIPLLQRALRGSPRAALLLARQYLDAGQPAAALDIAAPWCNSGKADIELSALHVAAYAALGRHSEAVAHYRRLLALTPQNAIVAHALAAALNAAGQTQEGERVARDTLRRGRPSAALYDTHARSLITLERFDEAEQALRECLRLEPRRAEAHDRLAQLVWMRTGDITQTTRELDQALIRYTHDDALWATKASVLQGARDPRGALECLTERAARPQAHPNLLIRAGLAALEFEPGTALGFAERALRAHPGNPTARKLLCGAYLGVGEARKALAECMSLLETSPDDQYLIAMQATALRLLRDAHYELLCDYDRMVFSAYLEPPAGYSSLDRFLTELTARLSDLHSPHGYPLLYQSLRQGTETTQDLSRSRDPLVSALFESFAALIRRYQDFIGHGDDPLRRRNGGGSRFNGGWSVRLHSGGYHASHVHPRGWISSACYIQLPDSMRAGHTADGILSFGAPGMLTTPSLAAEFSVRPEVGLLVMFPSYFWHGTLPFHSEQARLTVAFDAVPESGSAPR